MHARVVLGVGKGVLISEVEMHARVVLGVGNGVLFREVSLVQELYREILYTHTLHHSHTRSWRYRWGYGTLGEL